MPVYHIQPRDLLFFRDARPMEPQSPGGGDGAHWPHPAVFFDALHAALWRAFPDAETRKEGGFTDHSFFYKKGGKRFAVSGQRTWFHSLATAGPFPVVSGRWLFHAPADALRDGGRLLPITEYRGLSNWPLAHMYPLGSTSVPSKGNAVPWWSKDAIEAYLAGCNEPGAGQAFEGRELFDAEWATGIGTNDDTDTQDGERIYSARYLRLRGEVRLGLWASLPDGRNMEGLDRLFHDEAGLPILITGGQQRICRVERQGTTDLAALLPVSRPLPAGCVRVKWVLLSPAVFAQVPVERRTGGWLPTWICAQDGSVLLNKVEMDKASGTNGDRKTRRRSAQPDLLRGCRLVAACVPPAVPVTGWTEALHVPEEDDERNPLCYRKKPGPRETQLAVPAGAVYYFECPDADAAKALWEVLAWHGADTRGVDRIVHRRSSLLGEKGFGIGICGTWEPYETAFGRR